MSAKAGTIQGTQTGVGWAGARIAAILLAVVLTVTMFAMTRGGSSGDTVPAGARFEETQSGGGYTAGVPAGTLPAREPIVIGSDVCHQCR